MSSKYKFSEAQGVYFITATVVDWVDVFTRNVYRDILVGSFRHCQKNQGLQIHAWVLMPRSFSHDLRMLKQCRPRFGDKEY